MGCCLLGALILSQVILTFERVQQFFAPLARALRWVGISAERIPRGLPTAFLRSRRFIVAVIVAELAIAVPLGLTHADHVLALLQSDPDQITGHGAQHPGHEPHH